MQRKLYRELWNIRFLKMLELEKKSIQSYEALLEECRKKHKGHSIEPHLERLIADEKKHERLVRQLLEILRAQLD